MDRDTRVKVAFGKAVRHFRIEAGLSQEALAARAELNRTYLGDIERGERNVAVVNMYKIAKALGVSLSDLVRQMERELGGRG